MSIRCEMDYSKVDENKLKISIPKFVEESVEFIRDEKKGFISIRSNRLPKLQELFFNYTAKEILERCNGENRTFEIVEYIQEKYSLDKEEARRDVLETLFILTRYQFIDWIGGNIFMKNEIIYKSEQYTIVVVDESDIRELLNYNKQNKHKAQYIHILSNYDVYIDELFLREMLFNYSEDFYVIKNKDEEIEGVVSLKYNNNTYSTVASIGIMMGDMDKIKFLLENILEVSNEITEFKAKKIKVQFVGENQEEIKNILKDLGFELEYTAKSEFKGLNVENYTYFLNKKETRNE